MVENRALADHILAMLRQAPHSINPRMPSRMAEVIRMRMVDGMVRN